MTSLGGAVAAALGSAVGYACASVLQHRQAKLAPPHEGGSTRLIAYLVTRPMWLAGLGFAAVGLVLHGVALSLGQLTVIQPLLLSGLLFALPASVLLDHRRPSVAEWCWALVLVAGIAGFLIAADPSADRVPTDTEKLAAMVGVGVGLSGAAVAAGHRWARYRAVLYGLAAGIAYGLTAALIKQVTAGAGRPLHLILSWFPYALVAIGVSALLLSQVAYRAGPLSASLPPLTMAEPIVAVILGVTAFSERLHASPPAVVGEVLATLTVAVATVELARRSSTRLGAGGGRGSAGPDGGEGGIAAGGEDRPGRPVAG